MALTPDGTFSAVGDDLPRSAIVAPANDIEVAAALAHARQSAWGVVPVGGGTLLHVGNPASPCDVVLRTTHLSGLVEYNPADLTVVVRAGTTFEDLDRELGRHGQFLPLQPPHPQNSTVGGALAANASGPWRQAYGSARDMVIGMRVALPSGEIARSGGKVVKNVAGYDLAKLFIGSYGSLGVIVEAAFKLFPRPATSRSFVFETTDVSGAFDVANRVRTVGPGILMLAVVNQTVAPVTDLTGPAAVATIGGSRRGVDDLSSGLVAAARSSARELDAETESSLFQNIRDLPAAASARLSTAPSQAMSLADLAGDEPFLSYPGIGLTYLVRDGITADEVTALRRRLAPNGGSVVLLRAPAAVRRAADVWGSIGPELALMRKVKTVFDPERIMSPGRFVAEL